MKRTLLFLVLILVSRMALWPQVKHTANTLKLAEGQPSGRASLADMAWLAGSWEGTGLDGLSSENWGKPAGGMMMGSYRLVKEGKPVFFEALFLFEQEGTLILRLKHFHPNLVGWEEKDKTVDFKFVKKDGKRMFFSGLTFDRTNPRELAIFLALRQKDGSIREEIFRMKRTD